MGCHLRGGMPSSLFSPFDAIQPSEILSQYSEWIYFTLILIFFISISGIALRKHFDKPYVKPLIISVGLFLTFGVFKFKSHLTSIFEGWGILGTILLVVMGAAIPYGLCRGFGLAAGKAFYLSYILIYILTWVKFPEFYKALADHNLGFINLGLLILFFVSIFKVVRLPKFPSLSSKNLDGGSPFKPQIDQEIREESVEDGMITGRAEKMTKLEIRSIEDISRALDEIQQILESNRNNIPREERERIAHILDQISKDEDIFKRSVRNLQKLFQRLGAVDAKHFREIKDRLTKATGKEKRLLKAEIADEEEKLTIEKTIFEFERKLGQSLKKFNQFIISTVNHIRGSPYPYDAMGPLSQAGAILKNILQMIKETKALEEKLISLTKVEKGLLKKERKVA